MMNDETPPLAVTFNVHRRHAAPRITVAMDALMPHSSFILHHSSFRSSFRRIVAATLLALILSLPFATTARADEPPALEQAQPMRSCAQVPAGEDVRPVTLPGADESGACLFWSERWQSYSAYLINQRSIDEFRRTKERLQPLLADAGIDLCRVAAWSAVETSVRRTMTIADRQDAGRRCRPEVVAHGPQSEKRVDDMQAAMDAAVARGEDVFQWSLTWPLRVHLYDDHRAFVQGNRTEGGDQRVTERSLANAFGRTVMNPNGMLGFLLDASRFPGPADLGMVAAHEYAHIIQTGLSGGSSALPWFAVEGGAEYFASLVVGPDQPDLVERLRVATADERSGRAVPLREVIRRPDPADQRRSAAAYSRGYAAFRFLADHWGADAFGELYTQNIGGSPSRFLDHLKRITGLSLDDFDAALSDYLRAGA
jgi:hypothetical protein